MLTDDAGIVAVNDAECQRVRITHDGARIAGPPMGYWGSGGSSSLTGPRGVIGACSMSGPRARACWRSCSPTSRAARGRGNGRRMRCASALARHDAILARAVEDAGGRVVKTMGDGVMAVFASANDGVVASLTAQRALLHEPWPESAPIRVRMGLHVGEADGRRDRFPRTSRQPDRADHGRGPRRPGPPVGHHDRARPRPPAGRRVGARPRGAPAQGPRSTRARLPARPPGPARRRSGPLATVDERHGSLPAEPSAFVGREAERAAMAERLTDTQVRLLTLTGAGRHRQDPPGDPRRARRRGTASRPGAAFVDLSEARDDERRCSRRSRATWGTATPRAGSQLDELAGRIGTQQLLTVLDNFEQVAVSAPALVAAAPRLPRARSCSSRAARRSTSRASTSSRSTRWPCPAPRTAVTSARARSSRTRRSGSSSSERARCSPISGSPTTTPRSSRRSAAGWRACRWRSSWRRRASASSRSRRSATGSGTGSRGLGSGAARPARSASRRCARRSTGATSC